MDFQRIGWQGLDPDVQGRFDLIHCNGVLYHEPNPMLMIQALRPMLADDGELLLGTMLLAKPELSEYARFVPGAFAGDRTWWWVPGRLAFRWMMEAAGFELGDEFGVFGGPPDAFPVITAYQRATLGTPAPELLGESAERLGEGQLHGAQRLELEPHDVARAHRRRRGEHAGDDAVAGAEALAGGLRAARPRRPPSPRGGRRCARRARARAPRRSRAPGRRPASRSRRAARTPRRGGRCSRRGSAPRPRRGPAGRPPRAPAAARRSCGASSPSSTATSCSTTVGRRRWRASAPSASRPAVERNPASGASMPSFSCTAGTLKPTFQPIAWAPSSSISRRRASIAPVAGGHAGLAHGRITIFSASRRS